MLAKLLYGYKATQCLYVAAKLNIADHIFSGTKSVNELARLTDTKPEPLYRIMRCLAALGVFIEEAPNIFALNEAAHELRSDSDNTMKDFIILCGEDLYQAAGNLLHTAQTGEPAFDHLYGMSYWDYLNKNPDKAAIFHNAMETGSLPMIRKIISHYDFSEYQTIVDVGGGKGHLICEILSQYPHVSGVLYDLPHATSLASEYINKLQLADRCSVITGDFFHTEVPTADIYLLKVVLHDWDDAHAELILRNCRRNISQHGKIIIIEKIIDQDQFKDLTCLGDINMLATLRGKERSLAEFTHLFEKTGFSLLKKINTDTVFSIIEARPI